MPTPRTEGEMDRIGGLLEAQLPGLRRYAQSLTRDRSGADDLMQTCLMRALARQHQWQAGTDLRAWLFTILRNEFITQIRRRSREEARALRADLGTAVVPGSDPEMALRVREVENALKRLPAWQRQIVLRIGLERDEYGDTAAMLGIPVGTVRSRLARARERLRELTDR
jgi:RNA polymerase sigma-70 factor, ECF subfamily